MEASTTCDVVKSVIKLLELIIEYIRTTFLDDHPGGRKILLRNSGQDASEAFWKYHNKMILDKQASKFKIGTGKHTIYPHGLGLGA
jgi:hypothetical protein